MSDKNVRQELFELALLGGAIERRWRRMRPSVTEMPWHQLEAARLSPKLRQAGQRFWTRAALAEHRAAASSGAVQRALVEARAPIDLIAMGGGFVLDELAHVEMCARVANELGGGAALAYDPATLVPPVALALSPLGRAAELVLQVHCVSETFLLAMQRINRREQKNPLIKAVLASVSKDEAAHARFGWLFFDWAEPLLADEERAQLSRRAAECIAAHLPAPGAASDDDAAGVGWMSPRQYHEVTRRVMEESVCEPLRERGLLVAAR
jgi:hypothetical protein